MDQCVVANIGIEFESTNLNMAWHEYFPFGGSFPPTGVMNLTKKSLLQPHDLICSRQLREPQRISPRAVSW